MSNAQNNTKTTQKSAHRIRKTVLFLLLIAFLISLTLPLGMASGLIGIHFPQLTGSYAVGKANYDLLDPSRHETLGPNSQTRRELMVTIYYPAHVSMDAQPAPYAEGKMAEQLASLAHMPTSAVSLIHSHAYEHARVADGAFPLVLFSPGIGVLPLEYTSLVEDLASHGYVVAMIYHTYSVAATVFPDGHVATLSRAGFRSENEPPGTSDAQINKDRNVIGSIWVADARFTLNQLTKLNTNDSLLNGHLKLTEVGMYGHSFGGATTAETCQIDLRFKACINMDGTVFSMTNSHQIRQPFMWMASDYSHVTNDQLQQVDMTRAEFDTKIQQRNQQRETFVHSLRRGYMFKLKGSTHSTYITDNTLIGSTPVGSVIPGLKDELATIDGTQAVTDINTYVSAFFSLFLKHQEVPLFKRDAPQYPEVDLQTFGQ